MKMSKKREALKGLTRNKAQKIRVLSNESLGDNTVSFTFISDDNGGTRYDWESGKHYTEILDVNGANSERLNTFFKNHSRDVDSAIGVISNVRVENDTLVGQVTFGSDDDAQRVLSKYKEGILTDVSIGYNIQEYRVEESADNEQDVVTVTKFEIFEVSAVGIGFDSGAKKREKGENSMNEKQKQRLNALVAQTERSADENTELKNLMASRDAEIAALKAEKAEILRKQDIETVCRAHNVDNTKFLDDKNATADTVRKHILDLRIEDTQQVLVTPSSDTRANDIDAIVDGLALRMGATIAEPHPNAEKFRSATLVSIANTLLPEEQRSFNPNEVAQRSLLTGDFPLLLESVGARILTAEFEAMTGTYKAWLKLVDVPDFRKMTDLTSSLGGGRLSKVKENGDLAELSGNEKAEEWQIETFGNKFVITREMIINDDLGNFSNLIAEFGRMAQTTANGIAYDLLQGKGDYSSYKMADGSGVFVASRNNAATDSLSPDALSKGRLAMAKHKSIDGKTPLNIRPKYLIVSPALEVTAKEILGATSKVGADNVNVPNVHQNSLELIVDPEITSDTAWYLAADRRTLKMGFLAGTNRAPIVKKNDSSVSRTTFEGVFDIGVTVEDFKGLYRGNV